MNELDLSQVWDDEPIEDLWLMAKQEYKRCVAKLKDGSDIQVVCGKSFVFCTDRGNADHRYCTRRPGHPGKHVSGTTRLNWSYIWDSVGIYLRANE